MKIVPDIKLAFAVFGIGLIIGALAAWWFVADYEKGKRIVEVAKLRTESDTAYKLQFDKARALEASNKALTKKIEVDDGKVKTALSEVGRVNRALARERGGLRDPYPVGAVGAGSIQGEGGSASGAACPPTDGRLSNAASGFLLDFAERCDDAARYANTCHAWAKTLEASPVEY